MSAGLFIAGIAVIWGAVLLSLVQPEHVSGGVWPISGPLWQRGRNILVHLNYTWREIILRCLNSPHGHQTSLSDLIWKLCFWHVGPSEQVHRARSSCILCISACARLASIEVVYLRKCAAMRVNEYVSQLSSPLRLSWTEAGGQLQGRVTAEKKGGVKIDLKRDFLFFKAERWKCAGGGDRNFKEKRLHTHTCWHTKSTRHQSPDHYVRGGSQFACCPGELVTWKDISNCAPAGTRGRHLWSASRRERPLSTSRCAAAGMSWFVSDWQDVRGGFVIMEVERCVGPILNCMIYRILEKNILIYSVSRYYSFSGKS